MDRASLCKFLLEFGDAMAAGDAKHEFSGHAVAGILAIIGGVVTEGDESELLDILMEWGRLRYPALYAKAVQEFERLSRQS